MKRNTLYFYAKNKEEKSILQNFIQQTYFTYEMPISFYNFIYSIYSRIMFYVNKNVLRK